MSTKVYEATNYVFPAKSVNGMTLNDKRELLKYLRVAIKEEATIRRILRADAKAAKAEARAEKAAAREVKRAEKIARMEARLAALKNPVGTAAKKAARKPGPVKIVELLEVA